MRTSTYLRRTSIGEGALFSISTTQWIRQFRIASFFLTIAVALLTLQACSSPDRLPAVPKDKQAEAIVDGMIGIRYWQKSDLATMQEDGREAYSREAKLAVDTGTSGNLSTANYLAISGGGEDGAFGAGLLVGWSETGTRPEFKLVTGISTGALSAPFAVLGPYYDPQLKAVYTEISSKDVLKKRSILAAVFDDALADNAPLRRAVAKYVTPEMLQEIAAEYAKGRILLVGTTNLDARRPVIWNITKIATIGTPEALELVRDILVASTSIPAAFPPAMIDVVVDGQPYQEMLSMVGPAPRCLSIRHPCI